MPSETTPYEAEAQDTVSSVWKSVAQKAGYLDPEPLWTLESICIEETLPGRFFFRRATSFLRRLAGKVQHWVRS
jgi:hypothetical protein